MAVTCTWDDDAKTMLCAQFEGRWNWLELQEVLAEGEAMLQDGRDTPVHLMVDGTQTLSLMNNEVITNLREWVQKMQIHPRIDKVCVVGSGAITNSFLSVFIKVAMNKRGAPLLFANTLEEARQLLKAEPPSDTTPDGSS